MSEGLWSQCYISPGQHSLQTPPFNQQPVTHSGSTCMDRECLWDKPTPVASHLLIISASHHLIIPAFEALEWVAGEGTAVSWEGGTAAGWSGSACVTPLLPVEKHRK